MSRKYMKTTTGTQAGTFRMYRDSDQEGLVFIELQVAEGLGEGIRNENRRIDCGYMHIAEAAHYHRGYKTSDVWDQQLRLRIDYQSLAPAASDSRMYRTSTTVKAFHAFVREYADQILQALLDSEGEVFNPITNEKRVPYPLHTSIPLQETWIRISDDEDALARVWDAEFKKLAGGIVPVKRWNNHDKTHKRPQNNIWAVIDLEYTRTFGMRSGVGLPPHLWTIIDPDTEKDIPIIDPAEHDAWIEKEYQQHVAMNEEIDRINTLLEQREDYSAGVAYPEPEPVVEPIWDEDDVWNHGAYVISSGGSIEFNPYAEKMDGYYDMTSLELIQEGLMKALLDVQRRISQQARDDVKEASE